MIRKKLFAAYDESRKGYCLFEVRTQGHYATIPGGESDESHEVAEQLVEGWNSLIDRVPEGQG